MNEAEATTDTKRRRLIKARTGVVVSAKSEKTVTVEVRRYVRHGKYKKYVVARKRYKAHDDVGCGVGDLVRIHETRPTSKTKRWRVAERLAKDGTALKA